MPFWKSLLYNTARARAAVRADEATPPAPEPEPDPMVEIRRLCDRLVLAIEKLEETQRERRANELENLEAAPPLPVIGEEE